MYATILLFTIFAVLFVQWYSRRRRIIKYLENINGPPPLPVIGNALELSSSTELLPKLIKLTETYGPVVKLWIGPTPSMLIIQDPAMVDFVLNSPKTLAKGAEYFYLKDWIGEGILSNEGGARWAKHRKIIAPAFYYNVLEKFIPVFTSVCDKLVEKLEQRVESGSFDISNFMKLYTLDNTCECVMGTAVNALEDPDCDILKCVSTVSNSLVQRCFNPLLQPEPLFRLTKLYRRCRESFRKLSAMSDKVIFSRRSENALSENIIDEGSNGDIYGKKKRLAFLDLLLDAAKKDPSLTDEFIKEEVGTFLFAGHDTTQVALTFCLHSLAANLDIQEKVVDELHSIFGSNQYRPVTLKDMNDMKYIDAVIKETLRLYPPVPYFARRVTEDVEYGGSILPKGLTLAIGVFGMHRDPKLYPNPLKFDPDRFVTGEAPKSPNSYLPFSTGPRDCIGRKFAMIEMKLTIANLLRRFEFLPAIPNVEIVLVSEIVLTSHTGVHVQLKRRDF